MFILLKLQTSRCICNTFCVSRIYILALFTSFTPQLLVRKKLFSPVFYFPIIYYFFRNLINKAIWHERVAVVWQIPGWGMSWHHEPVRWHSWWSGALLLIPCWLCVLCILRTDLLHFWKDSLGLWLYCLYRNRPETLNNCHLPFLTENSVSFGDGDCIRI